MLSEVELKQLETYFGFLRKSKSLFVGRNLEMKLKKNEISYLILFPSSCSSRSKENLYQILSSNVVVLEYTGEIKVHELLNQKEIKALGIK